VDGAPKPGRAANAQGGRIVAVKVTESDAPALSVAVYLIV